MVKRKFVMVPPLVVLGLALLSVGCGIESGGYLVRVYQPGDGPRVVVEEDRPAEPAPDEERGPEAGDEDLPGDRTQPDEREVAPVDGGDLPGGISPPSIRGRVKALELRSRLWDIAHRSRH